MALPDASRHTVARGSAAVGGMGRTDWQAGRFGTVAGYDGEPLAAPPFDPARLRPPAA